MRIALVCAVAVATTVVLGSCSREGKAPAEPVANGPGGTAAAVAVAGASDPLPAVASAPLPASAAGWTRSGAPKRYDAGDLWEYIDGAAEQFNAYGFEELTTATYAHPAGATATVDVYRMADPLNAFGIYAQETNPRAGLVAVGVEGRASVNAVNFWSASSYVKIVSTPARDTFRPGMIALAEALAGGLGPAGQPPAQLRLFPPKGLVPGSVKYTPADILGQRDFKNGFEAQYQTGPQPSTLVLVPFETPEGARAALGRYESFLAKSGQPPKRLAKPGDGGFSAHDSFSGLIVAARSGRWLTISVGAPDESAADRLLLDLGARLAGDKTTSTPKAGTS